MKIENKMDKLVSNCKSGTLVIYGDKERNSIYGVGYILEGCDGELHLIDLSEDAIYHDVENYSVIKEFEKDSFKIVIEEE